MKKIGFLGCGKIGQALLAHITEKKIGEVVFIEDPFVKLPGRPVVREPREECYREAELVIECATADVLKEHIEMILRGADLFMFSVTAFSDREFEKKTDALCRKYHRHIYIPHGAVSSAESTGCASVICFHCLSLQSCIYPLNSEDH